MGSSVSETTKPLSHMPAILQLCTLGKDCLWTHASGLQREMFFYQSDAFWLSRHYKRQQTLKPKKEGKKLYTKWQETDICLALAPRNGWWCPIAQEKASQVSNSKNHSCGLWRDNAPYPPPNSLSSSHLFAERSVLKGSLTVRKLSPALKTPEAKGSRVKSNCGHDPRSFKGKDEQLLA